MKNTQSSYLVQMLLVLGCTIGSPAAMVGISQTKQNEITVVSFPKKISPYIVALPKTALEKRVVGFLGSYLEKVLHSPAKIVSGLKAVPSKSNAIILYSHSQALLGISAPANSPEAFALETRKLNGRDVVIAVGNTELGLKRAVQKLIIKSEQREPGLVIPGLKLSESPWMKKREWAMANHTPQMVRGVFVNPNADRRFNIWQYSDQQLESYVNMLDWLGFSGGQFGESTIGYMNAGSKETLRDRDLKIAKALRANGQLVTYRVWGAQFDGYGWVDPTIVYTPKPGNTAFNDPTVRSVFEKAYDHYAGLAPYVDLLVCQYYDPGQLKNRSDVFSYMHLLLNKFKVKNPGIELGVTFWASGGWKEGSEAAYMQELIDNGFSNALLLENGMPHTYKAGAREKLHEEARKHNLKLGVWDWHGIEKETDQAPDMYVNAHVLSNFYRQMRDGVDKIQPIRYWSEMEAYHLNNIYSAYAAAQLLWNPDRDPNEILSEIADGIWGPQNGSKIFEALKLIQDIHSGSTWETYWSGRPGHRFGTENPQDDLERANKVLESIVSLKTDTAFVPKFPLPFPPSTFVELMIPHIRQIQLFAAFRIKEKAIRDAAKGGASAEQLKKMGEEAWQPIPEYNTWIGTFGQMEARQQEAMMNKLGKDLGIEFNPPAWMVHRDADRYLQRIENVQKRFATAITFKSDDIIGGRKEFYWPPGKIQQTIDFLVNTGSLKKLEDGTYMLAIWEYFKQQ